MKDYIIWLKSGECITGNAEERILNMLKDRFGDNEGVDEKITFSDSEGTTIVNINQIEAIAINKQYEQNSIGFVKED